MKSKFLFASAVSIVLSIGFDPAPAQAQYAYACTREYFSSVNLRRGPSRSYPIIASIPNQQPMRMLSWVWGPDNMRWFRVESNGIVGFARADYVCW
jgi:uncharacterized protein YraI